MGSGVRLPSPPPKLKRSAKLEYSKATNDENNFIIGAHLNIEVSTLGRKKFEFFENRIVTVVRLHKEIDSVCEVR